MTPIPGYVLMSQPLVYKLTNESDFLSNLREGGFRKVIFTDGYDNSTLSIFAL